MDHLPAKPPGKPKNTGIGSLFILQQIFPTQELNQGLLHYRQILYQLSYQGSPKNTYIGEPEKSLKTKKGLVLGTFSPPALCNSSEVVCKYLRALRELVTCQKRFWLSIIKNSKSWSSLKKKRKFSNCKVHQTPLEGLFKCRMQGTQESAFLPCFHRMLKAPVPESYFENQRYNVHVI